MKQMVYIFNLTGNRNTNHSKIDNELVLSSRIKNLDIEVTQKEDVIDQNKCNKLSCASDCLV